jgi:WD40 repeat protein
MNRFILAILLIVAPRVAQAQAAEPKPAAAPDFARDVMPIFTTYCNGCHNSADREGKLSLEKFDELTAGGKGGVVVVPGKPELSRLVLVLEGREKPVMPPEGNEAPKPEEVALLKSWILAGAHGPKGQAIDPTKLVTPKIAPQGKPRDAITALAMEPSGKLAALGRYGRVEFLLVAEQAPSGLVREVRGQVTDLEFSRDGKLLVAAAGEPGVFGEAQLFEVASGKLVRTFTGHRDSLYAAALSPDAKIVATASYDQTVKLWDAATGKELQTLVGHNGAVFDVTFHPQGTIVATAGADRTVKLWDVATGARLDTFSQATKEQYAVAFSPDGRTIVTGGADNRLRVYRLSASAKENTNPLVETRYAHEGPIIRLAYSADGKQIVSAGEDRTVRVWDAAKITEQTSLEKQSDWTTGLAISADGKSIGVGRMDGTFALYDSATGKVRPAPLPELAEIEPRGVERGKKTPVVLKGQFLAAVTKLELRDASGRAVAAQAALRKDGQASDQVGFDVTVDPKTPRGALQVVAVTAAGKSSPISLLVETLPQEKEAEPNQSATRTAPRSLDVGYWGTCAMPGDVDHFRFAAKKGESLVCRLEAKSLGSMLDGFLTVLDPDGEVAASANNFDESDDPVVAYTAPRDGIYAVRVNDQAMAGSPKHFYRLSVGRFPLVTGAFPLNVPVGRETAVALTGYNLPADALVKVNPKAPGDVVVPVDAERFQALRAVTVRATADAETAEQEPNNAPAEAKTVALPAAVSGRIFVGSSSSTTQAPAEEKAPTSNTAGKTGPPAVAETDVDLFRFEAKKGKPLIIETEAERRGSPVDTKIEILTADGKPVPRVLLQAVRDSYITFRGIDSNGDQARLFNWEEMELNQYVYMSGEVCKLFRKPQGPDSGFLFYLVGGKRRDYFDTSAAGHALDEPAYIVEPHPTGAKLVNNGLPVYVLNYVNDDDAERKLGSDSRLTFTPPADGAYLVRVTDVRGFTADNFNYRLTIREPKPDFEAKLAKNNLAVSAGSGVGLTINLERIDGLSGDVVVEVKNVPPGYTIAAPIVIQDGHDSARTVLTAAPDAKPVDAAVWKKVEFSAVAKVDGKDVIKSVVGLTGVSLEEKPKLVVRLEPAELTIAPGTTINAKLIIERNGFKDRVAFDVANLPHGIIVDNIGLNGILIPEGQTEREVFLTCDSWVPETDRLFFAETKTARAGGGKTEFEASAAVRLKVRREAPLVRADEPAKSPAAAASAPK